MKYVIEGADRATGEDRSLIIEASGKADAEAQAAKLGWLLSAVRLDRGVSYKTTNVHFSDFLPYIHLLPLELVNFACPSCSAELCTKLKAAGRSEACPSCRHAFVSPGADLIAARKTEKAKLYAEKVARKAQERANEEQRRALRFQQAGERAQQRQQALNSGPVITCNNPHCGYRGTTEMLQHGSVGLGIVLVLFVMILPGVLYLIFCCYKTYHCEKCGTQLLKA